MKFNKHKFLSCMILFVISSFIFAGCTPEDRAELPGEITPETIASATDIITDIEGIPTPTTKEPVNMENGIIQGTLTWSKPPTPPVFIYAVDTFSGLWFSEEIESKKLQMAFEITVKPGTYKLYAFSEGGDYAAHAPDSYNLASVTVASGEAISSINIQSPILTACAGPTFGVPASPDGKFAEVPGPTAFCAESDHFEQPKPVEPEIKPFDFGLMQSISLTGVPAMLPPEFPVDEGETLSASLMTGTLGEYEILMEYGDDCNGQDTCYYGAVSGVNIDEGGTPLGSSSFVCEVKKMKIVELEMDISGYFIGQNCGPGCGAAQLFWIYEDVQYMIDLKAASMDEITTLVNAAILNSIH